MAHIKVVRRSMRPEEWTQLRFGWLQRGLEEERVEITGLRIRDAHQIAENSYEFIDGPERELRRGDLYFTPDGTAFIHGHATLPEHFLSRPVYLRLKTTAEMLVKVNGRYAGGIDPNRDKILLTPYLDGRELEIEIEAYNRSKPDDERNPATMAKRGCRQIFDGAYLTLIRENLQSLIYDFILLMDIAECEAFPEDYRQFLWIELSKALDAIDFENWTGIDKAAEHVEQKIYANTDFRGIGDVALVGHSHLDIAYYWRRIHAVQKNARTVLIQMRLMDRYPEFRYTHTQPYLYETLEKYYPDLFSELQEKVRSGQFEPAGAMYVEPDCNIPSAESLIRQLLYGQQFYRRAFGRTVDNAWLPDVFGNSWILPQILRKSGVDYFVSNKMSTWNDTNRFPHNHFKWKGIDGSTVNACVPPTHFITWNMPSQIQENWDAYQDKEIGGQTLSMYGYGDGGSGVTEEMLELARRFKKVSVLPKTELTGGAEFLHRNLGGNEQLAVWDGELYLEMHRGTFTTKSDLKRANRELEFMLREAEMLCAFASLQGESYPVEEFTALWKKLLLNQFHDILPGSHIHPVFEDTLADYREIRDQLRAILDAHKAESSFNSLPFPRRSLTFIPSPKGTVLREEERGFWAVPNLAGLSSGTVQPLQGIPEWLKTSPDGNGSLTVETPFYCAVLNPDGSFASLYDREMDREWVKPGCGFNKMHLWEDHPGMYDAWDILPGYRDVVAELSVVSPVSVTMQDGVSAELTVAFATQASRWEMVIRFFAQDRAIEVEHRVDWHEEHKLAKVNFGPDLVTREVLCDTSAGYIRRSLTKNTTWEQARYEVCHHKWFDLSETGAGIAVINRGKYGLGLEGDEVSLSLLRATVRPDPVADRGQHTFCYRIVPHAGDAVSAQINQMAFEYNIPLIQASPVIPEDLREAILNSGLWLETVKRAEDGESLILRLSEQDGARRTIHFPMQVQLMNMLEDPEKTCSDIQCHPFEILTVSVPLD